MLLALAPDSFTTDQIRRGLGKEPLEGGGEDHWPLLSVSGWRVRGRRIVLENVWESVLYGSNQESH